MKRMQIRLDEPTRTVLAGYAADLGVGSATAARILIRKALGMRGGNVAAPPTALPPQTQAPPTPTPTLAPTPTPPPDAPCSPHTWRMPKVGDDAAVCQTCGYAVHYGTGMSGPKFKGMSASMERRGHHGFREALRAAIRHAREADGRKPLAGI